MQYNSIEDRAAANLRLRYSFRDGRELNVVWNEGWHTRERAPHADGWATASRAVLIKCSHATWW